MISSYIQVSLTPTRLDDIRQGVRAYRSTWADLRREYPPTKSCFEPLNFKVSSWSAIASEDVTGLADDLDADEAYSQAATMAAYGADMLSSSLNGPTVDRGLVLQASNLLATLCATLMDTRDRHRDSVSRAIAEKVGAFGRILDSLGNLPQAGVASSLPTSVKQDKLPADSCEAPGHDTAEQQSSQMPLHSERRVSGPSQSSRRHPYNQGSLRSPASRQQPLHSNSSVPSKLLTQQPSHPPGIRLPTQHPVPKSAAPDHPPPQKRSKKARANKAASLQTEYYPIVPYRIGDLRKGTKINRRDIIRGALLKKGLPKSAITNFFERQSEGTKHLDKTWNRWVDWCDKQRLDPTKRSEDNLALRLSLCNKAELLSHRIEPAVRSVWQAIDGEISSTDTAN